ncbi:MAG: penicillin-binding protein 2 [Endomicrobium sp.]|jgi:cell division protein FtsI (penicillin-binding protein 3)|nr:penicillin-binding protein 2 [Endomicrobium sp.]
MKRITEPVNRRKVTALAVLFIFFVLFVKLVFVQVFMYSKINKAVEKMVRRENIEMPKRGDILDAKGRVLATSVRRYNLFIDPKIIADLNDVRIKLASYGIKIKQKTLKEFGDTSYFPLAYNLDEEAVRKIKAEKIFGVGFESKYIRQYPEGRLLAHILGITGSDGGGLEGIEKICNVYLSGEQVKTRQYKDGRGKVIHDKFVDTTKIRGLDITLTIDKNIQFIAEQELRKAFSEYKAKKAICIVQNPKNGAILAMVSLPDFDFSDKIKSAGVLRNAAISDIFEPGSTFKIVTVAAALNEDKIKLTDTFYLENGRMKIGRHTIRDDHKIAGYASLSKAMEQSSNIGMVKIAQKTGSRDFYDYIRKFGFYSLTGIDLPGEAKGILLDEKNWNSLSLPTISFGQSVGVTAIQLINSFSAVANGGVLMKPIIIKNIENTLPENMSLFEPKEIRRVISAETADEVKRILRNVVDKGTGKSAKIPGYSVGGKTGTAQKIDTSTKKYSTKYYVASFCGMLPAMEPELVILVIIDEPKGDYYASSVASPVFARIAERSAQYLNINKDDPENAKNDKIKQNESKKVKK